VQTQPWPDQWRPRGQVIVANARLLFLHSRHCNGLAWTTNAVLPPSSHHSAFVVRQRFCNSQRATYPSCHLNLANDNCSTQSPFKGRWHSTANHVSNDAATSTESRMGSSLTSCDLSPDLPLNPSERKDPNPRLYGWILVIAAFL
jgi:hypothetical protein